MGGVKAVITFFKHKMLPLHCEMKHTFSSSQISRVSLPKLWHDNKTQDEIQRYENTDKYILMWKDELY